MEKGLLCFIFYYRPNDFDFYLIFLFSILFFKKFILILYFFRLIQNSFFIYLKLISLINKIKLLITKNPSQNIIKFFFSSSTSFFYSSFYFLISLQSSLHSIFILLLPLPWWRPLRPQAHEHPSGCRQRPQRLWLRPLRLAQRTPLHCLQHANLHLLADHLPFNDSNIPTMFNW